MDACRELFDLEEITLEEGDSIGDVKRRIDEDWKKAADRAADEKPARIACLIVAHPSVLAPRQVNEIAEAVGEGIPTVFLVSSFSVDVSDEGMKKGIPITRHSSGLEDLFRTWGIGLGKDMLASPDCGDLTIPQQVAGALATVQIPSPMPFLVKAARDSIIQDHPLTKHCPSLVFPAAVELEIDGEGVKKAGLQATVIATSGKRSYTVPIAGAAKDQSGNDRPPSAVENKLLTDQGAYKDRFIEPKVLAVLLTGKFPSPSRGKPAPDWIEWWVEPAARKVFLDSPPGNVKSIDLAAARGEWESAQVVVRPKRQVSLRSAAGPALKGPADALIGEKANELRRVSFVPVPYAGRAYPDPLADPGFGTSSFPADSASPLLITVRVPRDVRPGAYQGTLRLEFAVLSDDKEDPKEETISVPVALRVWPFEIPERPSVKTAFGLSMDCALRCEGLKPGTPEARAMHERYYRVLLDHRISPYEIPVDLLDPEAGKFLDDPRVTSFQIPFRDDLAWVKARVERCREKGWLERAYFYPWDEPVTDEQYAALRSGSGKIRSLDPKLRIVSPFYCDAKSGKSAYDALEGLITIWCSVSAYFKPDRMEEKRKAGGEVWWYVCCGPGEPYANLHLTMDAMAHRILPWQMALHRIDGFLYWSTTYWNAEHLKDPWEDMVTVPAINKQLSGDGSLLYPGMRGGRRVAEGPVASLRLLLLRDGFEDLEYLVLLEKAAGRAAVDEAVKRLTPDLTRFTKDPAELERVRREVAARISQSKG